MKPSTYKKLEKLKKRFWKLVEIALYPLMLIIYVCEQANDRYIKRNTSPERVAKMIAKAIYKQLCKNKYDKEDVVHSADWTDNESGYNRFGQLFDRYVTYNTRTRKYYYALPGHHFNEMQKHLLILTMYAFAELNEYTYLRLKYDRELAQKTYYVKGYEQTYIFGIREKKGAKNGD